MTSPIWYKNYAFHKREVETLRQKFSARCEELSIDKAKVQIEIQQELISRAVHESNWQEGLELNIGKTQELTHLALEIPIEIKGPHIDFEKILDYHRSEVLEMKKRQCSEEEIGAFNLARCHFFIPLITLEIHTREIAAATQLIEKILPTIDYSKIPSEKLGELESLKQKAFQLLSSVNEDTSPIGFPLSVSMPDRGSYNKELRKQNFDDLFPAFRMDYIHFFHCILLMGISPFKKCGKYRKSLVHVGNPDLMFPPPIAIPSMMNEFCASFPMLSHYSTKDTILEAARQSHKFVSIHPYADGNGRISRLLMNLVLQEDYIPIYLKADKKGRHRYKTALKRADRGDHEGLASLIAISIAEIYRKMIKSIT